MKVKEIIEKVIEKTGMERLPEDVTCDKLIAGSMDREVTKIVTTFMATVEVIRQAVNIGADFIITHEPTWFSAADSVKWLENDLVYLEKKKLIEENHISIWRFHDHMHMGEKDLIYEGYDKELNWGNYVVHNPEGMENFGASYQIPRTTLKELCAFFKDKLNMNVIQIVGNPDMTVERVGVLVGGGSLGLGIEEQPMKLMERNHLDLVVCGDITEWTLSAYINDAAALGIHKGMLVLGHERSEEMGMKHLADWLKDITGNREVIFIDAKEPFQYL